MGEPLDSKVALVTGSGRGVGRATARLLASRGATVLVNDVNEDAITDTVATIRDEGGTAAPYLADVTVPEQVQTIVDRAQSDHGGVDILVNNAGGGPPGGGWNKVEDASVEDWMGFLSLNLVSVFLCTRAVLPHMRKSGRGHIVCVGSISGTNGQRHGSGYAAAKAGISGLVASVAKEYATDGVSCNGIIIGNAPHPSRSEGRQDELDRYVHLGRVGAYEEFASAIGFLCSEESSYLSGAMIPVDGGFHRFNLL